MRIENAVETASTGWGDASLTSSPSNVATAAASRSLAWLVHLVEGEIVPRLVLAQRQLRLDAAGSIDDESPLDLSSEVLELTRLLLTHEAQVACAYVQSLASQGISTSQLYLHCLAPAARRLGEMWERDECDFLQVTHGLCKLHQVLHRLGYDERSQQDLDMHDPARRILLTAAPGEQHTFGAVMVSQFFRAEGWDVWNEFPATSAEMIALVEAHWFAVVGLSVAGDVKTEGIADLIEKLRQRSRNRTVAVMVGGPALLREPGLVTQLGADATALDGRQAAMAAQVLFSSQPRTKRR